MSKQRIISASEARKIAEKQISDDEIQKINTLITKACKKGKTCVEIPDLSEKTRKYLESLGYHTYQKEVNYGYDKYMGDFIRW